MENAGKKFCNRLEKESKKQPAAEGIYLWGD